MSSFSHPLNDTPDIGTILDPFSERCLKKKRKSKLIDTCRTALDKISSSNITQSVLFSERIKEQALICRSLKELILYFNIIMLYFS